MKIILFALVLFSINAFADIYTGPAFLRLRQMNPGSGDRHYQLFECENGRCVGLVKKGGYNRSEWSAVYNMCRNQHLFYRYADRAVSLVGVVSGYLSKTPTAFSALIAFTQNTFHVEKEDLRGAQAVYQHMQQTTSHQNVPMSLDDFYHLKEGVKHCSNMYQDYLAHVAMGEMVIHR